jgi:hypothetical protein
VVNHSPFLAAAVRIHDETPASPARDELGRLIANTLAAVGEADRAAGIDQIYAFICADEQRRERLDELLPVQRGIVRGGFEALAGDRQADRDSFDRMVCPRGDYAWPILDVADEAQSPQVCPNDGEPLSFRAAGS